MDVFRVIPFHRKLFASNLWVYGSLFLVGMAFFSPSLNIYFLSDNIRHLLSASQEIFHVQGRYYRPVSVAALWLDWQLWGARPMGYHATNLLLHLANTLLVFNLGRRLISSRWVALAGALVFLFLPIHGISIFWISGRTDLMVTFFYLSSLLLFMEWTARRKRIHRVLSLFSFGLALFSKEMAVTLPAVLFAYAWLDTREGKPSLKKAAVLTASYWIVLMVFLIFRLVSVGVLALTNPEHSSNHPLIWAKNLIFYLGLLLVPGYQKEVAEFLLARPILLWVGVGSVFALLVVFTPKFFRDSTLLFFGLFLLLSLLPVLRLVMRWYLYLPSVGFSLFLVLGIWRLLEGRGLKRYLIIMAMILGVYAGFLRQEQGRWQAAGELAKAFSDTVCRLVIQHRLPGVLFTYVPAEMEEVPVFMYGMLKYLNFRLRYDFQYSDTIRVGILSHLALTQRQPERPVEMRWQTPQRLLLTARPDEAYFIFPAHKEIWTGKRPLVPGAWIEGDYGRIQVTARDDHSRITAVEIQITETRLPLLHWDGRQMKILRFFSAQ